MAAEAGSSAWEPMPCVGLVMEEQWMIGVCLEGMVFSK
jgi:hypothetical protein